MLLKLIKRFRDKWSLYLNLIYESLAIEACCSAILLNSFKKICRSLTTIPVERGETAKDL